MNFKLPAKLWEYGFYPSLEAKDEPYFYWPVCFITGRIQWHQAYPFPAHVISNSGHGPWSRNKSLVWKSTFRNLPCLYVKNSSSGHAQIYRPEEESCQSQHNGWPVSERNRPVSVGAVLLESIPISPLQTFKVMISGSDIWWYSHFSLWNGSRDKLLGQVINNCINKKNKIFKSFLFQLAQQVKLG